MGRGTAGPSHPCAGCADDRGATHGGVTFGTGGAARRVVLVVIGGAFLPACTAERAAPPADRYRCVVTPNDLVECNLVEDARAPAAR